LKLKELKLRKQRRWTEYYGCRNTLYSITDELKSKQNKSTNSTETWLPEIGHARQEDLSIF